MSGPNLRVLAYAISWDALKVAQSHLRSLVTRNLSGASFEGIVTGKPLLVLDYDGGKPRVKADVVDLEKPAVIARTFSSRIPELEDVWQQCWSRWRELKLGSTPQQVQGALTMPVLALVPRGWRISPCSGEVIEDSQGIAAMLVIWRTDMSLSCKIRWLNYV